ncbi:MAG: NAD+ synthase [Chloroflexi bacterium]|nr:NAD+ synthase [Chloroflexota bacterium]
MARKFRIALAQINPAVGDLPANAAKIAQYIELARDQGADLVAFPELALTGYPPEDLLLKPQFIQDNLYYLRQVARVVRGIVAVVGFVDSQGDIHNAAAILHQGQIADVYHKHYLPNYGVFDEDRYFARGQGFPVCVVGGVTIGVNICEDIWYPGPPTSIQCQAGAEVIVNINSSPYHAGKRGFRERMLATRATDYGVIVTYTNLVGGQDELVFDGGSFIYDQEGQLVVRAKQFEEDLLVADLDVDAVFRHRLHDPRRRKEAQALAPGLAGRIELSRGTPAQDRPSLQPHQEEPLPRLAETYTALVVGTRDYVRKNGFRQVVIGLSGGVDSSLTACVAVDALGNENVVGVSMPSRYSPLSSREDAQVLADNLGIRLITVPIEPAFRAYLEILGEVFAGTETNVAEENIQARIRGNILMALSNKFGWLVLTTGNKSEYATGYCTLYGDMAGGFAVIKDVPKTLVYELARYRNGLGNGAVIPESVMTKEPSAELRPGQRDVDSLPPYEVLDPILHAYVEEDRGYDALLALGFDEETVKRVMRLVDGSEYKRRQAPPGVKITPRAFGRDRRLPIVNKYRGF